MRPEANQPLEPPAAYYGCSGRALRQEQPIEFRVEVWYLRGHRLRRDIEQYHNPIAALRNAEHSK